MKDDDADIKVEAAVALVEAMAAIVNAVAQLQCLECLTLSKMPDIWKERGMLLKPGVSDRTWCASACAVAVTAARVQQLLLLLKLMLHMM